MRLFVDFKKNKKWVWAVYCSVAKQINSDAHWQTSKADLKVILDKAPARLRQNCKFATDHFGSVQ